MESKKNPFLTAWRHEEKLRNSVWSLTEMQKY